MSHGKLRTNIVPHLASPRQKFEVPRRVVDSHPHAAQDATIETMADEKTPPAAQPAAEGADKLHKDEVTGEMISKSERKCVHVHMTLRLLTVGSQAPPEAAREGC